MDLKPKKPKPKDFATDKPLADAVSKTTTTPANTDALAAALKETEKAKQQLKKAMEKSHTAFDKAFKTVPKVTTGSPKPGPIPIPYPTIAKMEKETKSALKGTETALKKFETAHKKLIKVIDTEAVALSKVSKTSSDEAGIARKGLIQSKNRAKAYAQAFSMDVKVEGKSAVRFFDIAIKDSKASK